MRPKGHLRKKFQIVGHHPQHPSLHPPLPPPSVLLFSTLTAHAFSAMENNVRPVKTAAEVEEDLKIKKRICKETESG